MRNYVLMAGFFIIFMWQFISTVYSLVNQVVPGNKIFGLDIICSIGLILIGVILAFLRKRDLYAVFFISISLLTLDIAVVGVEIALPIDFICLIIAIMYLMTRSEQKYIPALIYLLVAILAFRTFDSVPREFMTSVVLLISLISLYCAIAVGSERYKLPFRDLLTVDEDHPENDGVPIDFRVLGSSFGYIIFASVPLVMLYRNVAGLESFDSEYFFLVTGAIMIVMAMIMFTVSKLKQTPMIFLILGTFLMLAGFLFDMPMVQFVIMVALAAIVLMRQEQRMLTAAALIFFGLVPLFIYFCGDGPLANVCRFVTIFICIWISLGLHSNERIPIF